MDSNLLKDVANYWRKVKSGELPAPAPNDIDITVWTVEAAIKCIAELKANSTVIPDGYRLAVVPLEGTEAFRAACTAAFNESERGTGPCGVFIAGHRSMMAAAPDAVDIFADQVIGTKTKVIRMPAPLNVPQEGIRVYLNADELFIQLEKQGYIVEVSNE